MAMKVVYNVINHTVCAETRGGVRSRYIGNEIGSTMALLNSSQAVSDSWKYAPYGEVTRVKGSTATKLLYVGGASCRQDNSMNTYMQNRVLDVVKGKWKTQDPIGFRGRDRNLYRYALNSPATVVDPSGRFPCWLCIGLGILDPFLGAACEVYCYGRKLLCPVQPPPPPPPRIPPHVSPCSNPVACNDWEKSWCARRCHPYEMRQCLKGCFNDDPICLCGEHM